MRSLALAAIIAALGSASSAQTIEGAGLGGLSAGAIAAGVTTIIIIGTIISDDDDGGPPSTQ